MTFFCFKSAQERRLRFSKDRWPIIKRQARSWGVDPSLIASPKWKELETRGNNKKTFAYSYFFFGGETTVLKSNTPESIMRIVCIPRPVTQLASTLVHDTSPWSARHDRLTSQGLGLLCAIVRVIEVVVQVLPVYTLPSLWSNDGSHSRYLTKYKITLPMEGIEVRHDESFNIIITEKEMITQNAIPQLGVLGVACLIYFDFYWLRRRKLWKEQLIFETQPQKVTTNLAASILYLSSGRRQPFSQSQQSSMKKKTKHKNESSFFLNYHLPFLLAGPSRTAFKSWGGWRLEKIP